MARALLMLEVISRDRGARVDREGDEYETRARLLTS